MDPPTGVKNFFLSKIKKIIIISMCKTIIFWGVLNEVSEIYHFSTLSNKTLRNVHKYYILNINIIFLFELMTYILTWIGGRGSFCFKNQVLLFTTKIYQFERKKYFKMLRNVHVILIFSLNSFGVITYSYVITLLIFINTMLNIIRHKH